MSKIDQASASESLELLRAARTDAQEIFAANEGLVGLDPFIEAMRTKGWAPYDSRLALASLRATFNDSLQLYIQTDPYEL